MKAKLKSIGGALLLASVLSFTGTVNAADEVFEYCLIPACTATAKENIFLALLGLGQAKLSWWDCRVQNQCNDIAKSIGSLQINEEDCSSKKLEFFRKDFGVFDEKLVDVFKRLDPTITTAVHTPLEQGLEKDLVQHFVKCEKAGYFKPDTEACVTPSCDRILDRISKLEVNEAGCVKGLNSLKPNEFSFTDYPFEEGIIRAKVDAFKEQCIAGNLIPAMTVFGRAVLKKDEDVAKQCQQLAKDIEDKTSVNNVNEAGCTLDLYNQLNTQVETLKADLQKLDAIAVSESGTSAKMTDIVGNLTERIDKHYVQCSNQNLFPPDTSICFSDECKALQAKIEAFKVDKEQCTTAPRELRIETKYAYEHKVVEGFLEAYKQKCIDANVIPAATIYDRIVYQKDMPLATECESMGKALTAEIEALKVNEEDCKDAVFTDLTEKVSKYEGELKKLSAVTEARFDDSHWISRITGNLSEKVDNHFSQCEAKKLAPQDASYCRSKECKEAEAAIEALKVDKVDCEHSPSEIPRYTKFAYERTLIETKLEAYKQKCIDANIIPAATIYDRIVYQKNMPLATECKSMGDTLTADIEGLKVDKTDCQDAVYTTLKEQVGKFEVELKKLEAVSEAKYDNPRWLSRLIGDLDNKVDNHFAQCELKKLAPQDATYCRSQECQETEDKIAAFKVDEEDCKDAPGHLTKNWKFSYERDVIDASLEVYKQKCIQANIIPAATIYDRIVYQKNMPLAQECESMGKALTAEIEGLKVEKKDCTDELFSTLKEKVSAFEGNLIKLGEVTKAKYDDRYWIDHLSGDLDRKVDNHFLRCEEKKYFPQDLSKCRSKECKETEAQIEAFKIDKDDCVHAQERIRINRKFDYERQTIDEMLKLYKDRCIDANIIPAGIIFDRVVYQRAMPIAEQAKTMNETLEAKIKTLEVNYDGCSDDLFLSLNEDVTKLKTKLTELESVTQSRYSPPNKRWIENLIEDLNHKINQHFQRCEAQKYFPQDKLICRSEQCKATEAKIASFKVDKTSCENPTLRISRSVTFSYETDVIDQRLAAYKQKCIDANIIPAATIYDRIVYQRAMPIAEQCKTMGEALEARIKALEINKKDCTDAVFISLKQELNNFKSKLTEMEKVTESRYSPPPKAWVKDLVEGPNRRIDSHFSMCEGKRFFPQDPSRCFSNECLETLETIKAFKVNKADCQDEPMRLRQTYKFNYEGKLIQKWLKDYQERCKRDDTSPSKLEVIYPVENKTAEAPKASEASKATEAPKGTETTKEAEVPKATQVASIPDNSGNQEAKISKTVEQSESNSDDLMEKIAAMGHNGEKAEGDRTVSLIPYDELVKRIDSLTLNKNDCNYKKSTHVLQTCLAEYTGVYTRNSRDIPKDMKEIVNKLNEFQSECIKQHLYL